MSEESFWQDKVFPILLLVSFGLFSWAIRGQSGFGAIPGCVFAGTLWAIGWYFLGHDDKCHEFKTRPYNSPWSVLAIIFGIGISGMQGWMQWPAMIRGHIILNNETQEFHAINPALGYLWWFIVALHWAGIGAIALAWTGSKEKYSVADWSYRFLLIIIGALIGYAVFLNFPQWFLPEYPNLGYNDPELYPTLQRLVKDNREAIIFLGAWLGGLYFEIYKRDWRNIKLILFISILTGLLWMLFQYLWMIAIPNWFPETNFNWWRGWESSAGGSIGLAFGIAFVLYNKKNPEEKVIKRSENSIKYGKTLGFYLALAIGLGWSIINGIKGFLNLYHGIDEVKISFALPVALISFGLWFINFLNIRRSWKNEDTSYSKIKGVNQIVMIGYFIMRISGLLVTGPINITSERIFFYYYIFLAGIDILIINYYIFQRMMKN